MAPPATAAAAPSLHPSTDPLSETAAPSPTPAATACLHWQRGACRYGTECKFGHPPGLLGVKAAARAVRQGGSHGAHGKDLRQTAFRRFLVETLGIGPGSRVVEVAGGKGELSLELANLHEADTALVEPRSCLRQGGAKFQRKLRLGMFHRSAVLGGHPTRSAESIFEEGVRNPVLHRCFVKPSLVDPACSAEEAVEEQLRLFQKHLAAGEAEPNSGVSIPHGCVEVGSVPSPEETLGSVRAVRCALSECTHIVAMHPDEPTELIVDYALSHGKSFAVVPCCVFAETFPGRRYDTPEGVPAPVRDYDEFVEYLKQKSPEMRCVSLPMAGRCKVLYRVAPDSAAAAGGS